jgi:hypothetical protein
VRDPVKPGAQRQLAPVGPQARVRAYEHVLEHVLRIRVGSSRQHLTNVRQQAGSVAVMDDAEGVFVPGTEETHELLVRAQLEQRRR